MSRRKPPTVIDVQVYGEEMFVAKGDWPVEDFAQAVEEWLGDGYEVPRDEVGHRWWRIVPYPPQAHEDYDCFILEAKEHAREKNRQARERRKNRGHDHALVKKEGMTHPLDGK